MNFTTKIVENNIVFTIEENSIGGKSAADLKQEFLTLVKPDFDSLIIDMTKVNVIDSSGLGALLLAHRLFKDYDIKVILVGIQSFVRNLLVITRIEKVFLYYDKVEDAIDFAKNSI